MDNSLAFDLKTLEVFIAIVDAGGMTAAGQRLGITQSSVSQSLANLELSVSAQLLDRGQRPPVLTPLGREFYQQAKSLLYSAHNLHRQFQQPQQVTLNQMRIALVDSLATSIGKELIDAVKFRSSQWSLMTGQSHRHAEALLSRDVDMIMSDDPIANHPELIRYRLVREPFVLVVPSSLSRVHSLKNLATTADFIRYSHGTVIGRRIETQLQLWNIEPPTRLTLDNTYAIIELVKAGAGWTISTPLCVAQMGLSDPRIRVMPIPEGEFAREILLLARANELGDLPKQMARDSVSLLHDRMIPLLQQNAEWVLPKVLLGDDA
jgi:DNA-binding transcriptional LysR family regulator